MGVAAEAAAGSRVGVRQFLDCWTTKGEIFTCRCIGVEDESFALILMA